jgi:Raf kinase inhibitor-like YbhB/YbcL family protein
MRITSSDFKDRDFIPQRFTQFGENISPELTITAVPSAAVSVALICSDPDAPDPLAPQRVFTHWVLFNLPAGDVRLEAGIQVGAHYPQACEGLNDRGGAGYIGPRPPIGTHRYYFRAYALTERLNFSEPPTRQQLLTAMDGKVISSAQLIGLFSAHK